ncbi:MAG: hypothetical protein GEU83_20165 [Pseudonocardiaceae bacterium]|nr:hypothetical protein [Pseudonocardiaceae bacterium]
MASYEDNGDETAELGPLGTEEEFAELLDQLVADTAPHLFALVEERGERVDGRIAAWGMQFEDHVEVVAEDHGPRLSAASAERARSILSRLGTMRLVWCPPPTLPGERSTA